MASTHEIGRPHSAKDVMRADHLLACAAKGAPEGGHRLAVCEFWTVLALVGGTSACVSTVASGGQPASTVSRSKFSLRIPDEYVAAGRGRPIEMTLVNQWTRPLWVNARMRIGAPGLPPPGWGEVTVRVSGPSGLIPNDCISETSRPRQADYVVLQPEEHATTRAVLWCFPIFTEPGVYTAYASYQDRNPRRPAAPLGSDHLSEEVLAAPVQFRVLAR
jgi:hypothetical protein